VDSTHARRSGLCTILITLLVLCTTLLAGSSVNAAPSGGADFTRGQQDARAGHYAAAVQDYQQAILHGHNDPYTYWQLGLAYGKVKRWNDAVWAISTALTDDNFAAEYPQAARDLGQASDAGGVSGAPPAALRNAAMSPAPKFHPSAAQMAMEESKAAFATLQSDAFFVAPEWNRQVTVTTSAALSDAARSLNENADTTAKFVFLGATPSPYTDLGAYAKDLFTHLNLQRAVLVAVTPQHVAAYSDRLSPASAQQIANQERTAPALRQPAVMAAAIARAVTARADANDAANTRWSLGIGGGVTALIVAAVVFAIFRIMHDDRGAATRGIARRTRAVGAR
jgi:hypothetical protein